MTRREEIVKATKECRKDYVGLGRHLTSNDIADAFEEGAEWADKTMIEKACDWLKENIWVYINYESCSGEELENDVIEDFRKAMEE